VTSEVADALPDPHFPWRAEVSGWPIPWREAWGSRSRHLEEAGGLCWWRAEQQAHASLAHLKAGDALHPGAKVEAILAILAEVDAQAAKLTKEYACVQ
jgi:hypothetical protein